jgi:hypothetical protein
MSGGPSWASGSESSSRAAPRSARGASHLFVLGFVVSVAALIAACGLNASGETPDGGFAAAPDGAGDAPNRDAASSKCVIDKKTYANDAVNPDDPCEACEPSHSKDSWSVRSDGTVCGNGQICRAGACGAGCEVDGVYRKPGVVDPEDPCQTCQPSWSTTGWTAIADGTACGGGLVCANGICGTACDIGQTVYASSETNPANACQTCQPAITSTTWSDVKDGTECGGGEVCSGGSCNPGCYIGGTVYAPNTANTTDACESCAPSMSTTKWSDVPDGTACGTGDICHKGVCGTGCEIAGVYYAKGASNPNDACQSCQPGATTAWSNVADGSSCGNGQICSNGQCGTQCDIGGTVYTTGATEAGDACEICQPGKSTTAWTTLANGTSCGSGVTCVAGMCNGCVPGTTQCQANGVQTCNTMGQWGAAQACSASLTCLAGQCTGVCGPGQTTCSGNGVETCNGSGQWGGAVACTQQVCVGGVCTGVCGPNETRCAGNGVETCNGSGQWGAAVACSGSQTCVAGVCGGACGPGQTQCSGDTPQTCSSTGTWQNGAACSGGNPACLDGDCVMCNPGALGCNGVQPQTCDSAGAWQNTGGACSGGNPACLDGVCVPCSPGMLQCSGTQPQVCSATGSWENNGSNCSVCLLGSCVTCSPGTTQCNGTQPQTCDALGGWMNMGPACTGGAPVCLNAMCVECTPGTMQCTSDNKNVQTCSAGGSWTSMPCGGATCRCAGTSGSCSC